MDTPKDDSFLLMQSQLFVLRIWRENLGEQQVEWRACLRHVTTGETCYFRDWQKLEEFLSGYQEFKELFPHRSNQ